MKNQLLLKVIIDLVTVIGRTKRAATIDCQITDYYTFDENPEPIKVTIDVEGNIYIHELLNEDELENKEFNVQKILGYIDSDKNIPEDVKEDIRDRINHGEVNMENKIEPNSNETDTDIKDDDEEKKTRGHIKHDGEVEPNEDLSEEMDIEKEPEENIEKDHKEDVTKTKNVQNNTENECNKQLEGISDSSAEENDPLVSTTDNINEDTESTTPNPTEMEHGTQEPNSSLNKEEFDGKFAEPGQFKYHAQIRKKKKNAKICSGAIIHERMIVTSAKCLSGLEEKELKITAGTPDIVTFDVSKIILFNKNNVNYDDIALLKTKQTIDLKDSTNLDKVKYDYLDVPIGSNVTITGSKCHCSLKKLKYDVTEIVSNETCKDIFSFTNDESICGELPNNDGGIKCFEELGSPVVLDGYLVGIVSISKKGEPSRYISINYYIDWLIIKVIRNSFIP